MDTNHGPSARRRVSTIRILLFCACFAFASNSAGASTDRPTGNGSSVDEAAEALPNAGVRSIAVGEDGAVWVGTEAGLGRLDPKGAWSTYTKAKGDLSVDPVSPLAIANDGAVWMGNRGLTALGQDGKWKNYTPESTNKALPQHYIRSLAFGSDGSLWIGTGLLTIIPGSPGGLSHLDQQGSWRTYTNANTNGGLPKDAVTALAPEQDGSVWVGTEAGLTRLDVSGRWQRYVMPNPNGWPGNNQILSLALAPDNSVWVGTYIGLTKVDRNGRWLPFLNAANSKGGLPNNAIDALAVENDGSLWVGTPRGLAHLDKNGHWLPYVTPERTAGGLPGDDIRALQIAPDGSLWVGVRGGLAHRDKEGRWQTYRAIQKRSQQRGDARGCEETALSAPQLPPKTDRRPDEPSCVKAKELLSRKNDAAIDQDLDEVIDAFRFCLDQAPKSLDSAQLTRLRLNLGAALLRQGWPDSAKTMTWETARAPQEWVMIQQSIQGAIMRPVISEKPAALMKQSILASRGALEGVNREQNNYEWATANNNIGLASLRLSALCGDSPRYDDAIDAFKQALEGWTRERQPLMWASTHNNLGVALSGKKWFESAIDSYQEALKEWTRKQAPLEWATTKMNMGAAFEGMADLVEDEQDVKLHDAVSNYREALKEFSRARAPVEWARTQRRIGDALRKSGGIRHRTSSYEASVADQVAAISAYREALKEFTKDRAPAEWAQTQVSLGNSLMMLGEKDTGRIREAISVYGEVLKEGLNTSWPMVWSMARNNLIEAQAILTERQQSGKFLDQPPIRGRSLGSRKPIEVSPQ